MIVNLDWKVKGLHLLNSNLWRMRKQQKKDSQELCVRFDFPFDVAVMICFLLLLVLFGVAFLCCFYA